MDLVEDDRILQCLAHTAARMLDAKKKNKTIFPKGYDLRGRNTVLTLHRQKK